MSNTKKGKYGEDLAVNFLLKKGFKILERNFRYSKYGEIDIIAFKNGVIRAIEVKTRTSLIFGEGIEAVTKEKLRKIYMTLEYYLKSSRYKKSQIDVISILFDKNNPKIYDIKFLENVEYA